MKTYLKFGLAGFMLASSSAFSDVPPDGWYGGLFGTLSKTPSLDFTIPYADFNEINTGITLFNATFPLNPIPLLASPSGSIKYSLGYGGGVDIGYRLCGFRFEGELLFDHNPYDSLTLGGYTVTNSANDSAISNFAIGGKTDLGAALFNIYYDFYNFDEDVSWIPYVGLGLGYARVRNNFSIQYNVPTGASSFQPDPNDPYNLIPVAGQTLDLATFSETTSTPVGQLIAGVAYQFSENFSAGLDYRYVTTKTISILDERLTIHTLNLSFNFWFPNQ